MNCYYRSTKVRLLGAIVLFGALLSNQTGRAQSLTSIDVTPANPTINVGQIQPFTATGHFSDASTRLLSPGGHLAAGGINACALLSDGTVKCWGDNGHGNLGNGTFTNSNSPVGVIGITTATAIAAGAATCALLSDGAVNCWGWNLDGALGNGTNTDSNTPVGVIGITTATAIAAGGHTCALLSDGTVKCWGYNGYGELGNGTNADSNTPVGVIGITTATAVAVGGSHTCALLSDGTVKCWGANGSGQLGNGTNTDSDIPVSVSGITTATAIAAGDNHTCAVLSDGTVQCWGSNSKGQLGNGTNTDSNIPVGVSRITTATAIAAAGDGQTCAVLSDGTVNCWGDNGYGELGNGTFTGSNIPVPVNGISTATEIAMGSSLTCALLSDGTVKCWGYNFYGELGNGTTTNSNSPVGVIGISSPIALAGGAYHTCAVLSGGTVYCWGDNSNGQLGNGTNTDSTTPVLAATSGFKAIAAGDYHTCALSSTGHVWCWGLNDNGQLGNGTTTDSNTPVQLGFPISTATAIAAGGNTTCAVLHTGEVYCWGWNADGDLGNGTNTPSAVPVLVRGISTATGITVGHAHACALLSGGTVNCWGNNLGGELGDGTNTGPDEDGYGSYTPVTVLGITTATEVSAGYEHTCALLSDGRVTCWGVDSNGQLGDGSYGPEICEPLTAGCSTTPVLVSGITSATTIAAGAFYTCAMLADGTVNCWGQNGAGQLGNGTTTGSNTAVPVFGISSATAIAAGGFQTCAVLSDGTVNCWGANDYGQLGNGTTTEATTPVSVSGIGVALSVVWMSSNTAVATINANGIAAGLSPGTSTITATIGSISGSTTLTVLNPNLPDLIVSALSTGTTAIAAGRNISVSNTVKNQGTVAAGSSVVAFHLSTNTTYGDGDDIPLTFTRTVPGLAVGASGSATNTLTIPAATPLGSYYLCAKADSGNTVAESNENNNVSCTGATIQVTLSDLIMTNVTPNTGTVNQGGTLSVSDTVQNLGAVATPIGFRIGFHLSTNITYGDGDDIAITTNRAVAALGAGASSTGTTGLLIPSFTPPGVYFVCAKADSLSQVTETDETNNTLCSSTQVTVPQPDLIVSAISTTATTVKAGATAAVANTIKNQGGSKAGLSVVAFRLSTNTTYGDGDDIVSITTRTIGSLGIGAVSSATNAVRIPASTPPGSYYICANADNTNTVAESNESNNSACTATTITVTPQ